MTIKTIYSALISLAVLGLAACSTEVNNEQSQVINPETSSTRAFTLTPKEGPQTRTDVNISSRTKWTTGDRLIAYNITNPEGYDYLTAADDSIYTKFKGDIHWKGDSYGYCSAWFEREYHSR